MRYSLSLQGAKQYRTEYQSSKPKAIPTNKIFLLEEGTSFLAPSIIICCGKDLVDVEVGTALLLGTATPPPFPDVVG